MRECPGSERDLLPRGKSTNNTKETTTMANPEELEFLQDSADDWNIHRREHHIMHPNLSGANLSAHIPHFILENADGKPIYIVE
jgi:hypothetical protein